MQPYSEMLRAFMERTGISDAELARTLGVSRQTIFRWKEGLVEKPRYRDDVIKIATRLRLTPGERDEFLLSAGFAPETPIAIEPLAPVAIESPAPVAIESPTPIAIEPRARLFPRAIWIGAIFLIGALGASIFAISQTTAPPSHAIAAPGETLILIGAFDQPQPTAEPRQPQTLSATERVQAALEREIVAARLERVRVAIWREPIRDADAGQAALRRANARIVIVGALKAGDLRAIIIAAPPASRADDRALDALVAAPVNLKMNVALNAPEELHALALLVISQANVDRGDFDFARAALTLALTRAEADALNLQTGYVHQIGKPPDLPNAIEFYTRVIRATQDVPPEAYLNRGVAYLRQNDPRWRADLDRARALNANDASLALCWAHALDKQPAVALLDCGAAVRANPRAREARAIAYAQLGNFTDAANDLEKFNAWLAQQPEVLRARYGTSRAEWMQMLKAGQNPIDDAGLEKLRRE
ncbi:MAG: helix-turn-helix transcriptional regulator [Chloroflexi bacterium]|nr:helix-turn-helix transcriptional regulator [Chloroflexota bacterium]